MARNYRRSIFRYSVAAGSIALATWTRILLDPAVGVEFPYATLFFAVLLTAWYGGFGPALAAVIFGALSSAYFLIPPRGSFVVAGWDQQVGMALYIMTGLGIAVLGGMMRAARERAEQGKETERLQRERLHVTLQSIGDAVVATDSEGRVVFLNSVAETLTGWRQIDAQGAELENVFRIVNEETRLPVENPVAKVLREGQVVGLANHTALIARDGTERPIDDSAAPIRDEQGGLQGVVLVFRDISEKKRVEQEVRRAGNQARTILESITDAFCALDRDWRFAYVNRRAEVLLGRSRDDLVGKNHWEEYPDTLGTETERSYRRAVSDNVAVSFEVYFPPHDRCYEVHAYPSSDGLSVYFRDVSERRRAVEALRESQEKFRLLADSIPQLAWMAQPDGHIFWYNRRWYEYTGTTPEQMEGWGWQTVHDPNILPTVLERWKGSIANGEPFDMVFPLKGADDQFRPFLTRVNPLRDQEGRTLYWFGTNTDISEIKEMEAALQEKEARLRAIFEGSVDSIVMADDEGRYVEANPGASDLFGLSRDKLLGRRVSDFAEPGFPFDQAWKDFRESGRSTGEFRLVRLDGTVKDVEFAATADILPGRHLSILRDVTERKKTERALRETEARFAAVVNHSPSCIFVKDRQGRYLLGNRALAQMVGREPDDLLGRTDADFFPQEVVAQFGSDDAEILNDGRPRTYEESFPYAGTMVTALTVKFPLLDTNGTVYGVCGIATDITAQKRANEALAVSEERLRLALEAGRMGVWDWNVRTNEIKWSDNLEPIHGLAPGTFGGTFEAYQKLIHPDDRELVAGAIERAIEERSGYAVEFRNVWPDSSVHWIAGQGKVFTAEDGQPARMIGVGMDVTERKRSEQTARFLADASSTLATLVDYESTLQKVATLAVPFFADWATVDIAEEDGSLKRVAVAHVDPSKVELAHVVNWRFPSDPAAPQGLWNVLRTGQAEIIPDITDDLLVATVKDKELLHIMRELGLKSYMAVPFKVRGKSLGVITFIAAESGRRYTAADLVVAEDLAHRAGIAIENAQLYRELKDADRKKDEFLAVLAHELRNPLAPLSNVLEVMRLTTTKDQAEHVRGMMERQVRQMTRLVDDLLDISRITSGKIVLRKERLDLSEVMLSALETSRPLLEAGMHKLTITPPPKALLVDGDKTRLAQVLSNLLTNSAKYTPEGGGIWLTVERQAREALIRVRDNGMGIPAPMLPKIFDMFTQVDRNLGRSQGGLGIGLTLVRSLVEMHNGSVEARSEGPGRGSEFIIRLPLVPDDPKKWRGADERDTEPQAAVALISRRILVVDDNVDSAESLAMLLRLAGNEVRTAHEGPTALAVATDFTPEVVLLDIGLPGMDGYEVARRMRMLPSLKSALLVAQTGWGQEEDRRRSEQAGFDHHFTKPVDPAALQALLASLDSTEKKT